MDASSQGGYVNAMSMRNPGLQAGLKRHRPGTITSVAIRGDSDVSYALATIPDGLDIELNLSCPNVDKDRVDPDLLGQFVPC